MRAQKVEGIFCQAAVLTTMAAACAFGQNGAPQASVAGKVVASEEAAQDVRDSFFVDVSPWKATPETIPVDRIKVDAPERSMVFNSDAVCLAFTGVDPTARYQLEISFLSDSDARVEKISAGGIVLEDQLTLPKAEILRRRWRIPASAIHGDRLDVEVARIAGPNAIVSSFTMYADEPEAKPLKPIPAPPVEIPIVRLSPRPVVTIGVRDPQIDLDGTWSFNPDPPQDLATLPIAPPIAGSAPPTAKGWHPIHVPGEWVMEGFKVTPATAAAYVRTIAIPADWADRRVKLRCNGVYSDAKVWVNGRQAGGHIGGLTPFEMDITAMAKAGATNTIAIAVKNASVGDSLASGSQYAAHELGGISRRICLFATPSMNIADVYVRTDFDKAYRNAVMAIQAQVANDSEQDSTGLIVAVVLRKTPISGDHDAIGTIRFPAIKVGQILMQQVAIPVSNPRKWDPEHPNLYYLECALKDARGRVLETVIRRIGFRQVEVRGNQLFVNNRPVKLKGVCRHETHPLLGRATTPELVHRDAELFREMNANHVRTSHYPPTEEFIAACDELGLFVEVEAPFCWAGDSSSAATRSYILQAEMETVLRDRSSPSVLEWSMGNESPWGKSFALARPILHDLDSSRPYLFDGGEEPRPPLDIDGPHYPGLGGPASYASHVRPALFGEYAHLNCYNRRQLATDPGLRDFWGEGAAEMFERMWKSQGCLGGNIWAAIDDLFFPPGSSPVGYGTWGPLDGWRRPKPEYFHLKKIYSPIRISDDKLPSRAEDGSIRIPVENRYLFTDLSEVLFKWAAGKENGTASASVRPGERGQLVIPLAGSSGIRPPVEIEAISPLGFTIDTWRVGATPTTPDPGNERAVNSSMENGGSPIDIVAREKTPGAVVVKSGRFQCELDGATGMIRNVSMAGAPVLTGGPTLMLLPLIGDSSGAPQAMPIDYPPVIDTCSDWQSTSVTAQKTGGDIEVDVEGAYKQAQGTYQIRFKKFGEMTFDYDFTVKEPVNTWQIGLVFDVPRSSDTLSWQRKAQWSWYPEDEIGRPIGTAKATAGHPKVDWSGPHTEPTWNWSQDETEMGTNDFRSTKRNIFTAGLHAADGSGIQVVSDGTQHVRAWLDGSRVRILVADYVNAGSGAFVIEQLVPHRELKFGDHVKGTVRIRILN